MDLQQKKQIICRFGKYEFAQLKDDVIFGDQEILENSWNIIIKKTYFIWSWTCRWKQKQNWSLFSENFREIKVESVKKIFNNLDIPLHTILYEKYHKKAISHLDLFFVKKPLYKFSESLLERIS